MADDADIAQGFSDHWLELSMKNQQKKETAPETGFCLYCEEPISVGRFCGVPCREDFLNANRRKKTEYS